MLSSTAVTMKVTDDCPAAKVTVVGTVASVVSLLLTLTVSAEPGSVLRRIVADNVPPFSAIVEGLMTRVNPGVPSSLAIDVVAEDVPPTEAFAAL